MHIYSDVPSHTDLIAQEQDQELTSKFVSIEYAGKCITVLLNIGEIMQIPLKANKKYLRKLLKNKL